MATQEQIGKIIFNQLMAVQEEYGDDIALAFLEGVKFAINLQSELLLNPTEEDRDNFSEITVYLGEFYSQISKGEIS